MAESKKPYQIFKQNSELEVLISAAIVFTAFAINDITGDWLVEALNRNISSKSPILFVLAVAGLYMSAMLPISIVSHFLLRIYWMALVGLKSAYPEQKREEVNVKFNKIVNSSLNLDRRIESVDKICSSIFAFTFLTLFAFCFTFMSTMAILLLLAEYADTYGIMEWISNILLLSGSIYMIDFLTLGWVKKRKSKWFAVIYYPIYKFYGWITFAFLYRGIYYSLIQNTSRKVMLLITPIYIVLALFFLNQGYASNSLYPDFPESSLKGELASNQYYIDQFPERMAFRYPFMDSYTMHRDHGFLKIYFPMTADVEDQILTSADSIQVYNERGIHWRKWITLDFNQLKYDSTFSYQKNAENILNYVSLNVSIFIDNMPVGSDSKFHFTRIKETPSRLIFTILDVSAIERGEHLLRVETSESLGEMALNIPFWRD